MANIFNTAWSGIKNLFYTPVTDIRGGDLSSSPTYNRSMGGSKIFDKNLSNFLAPIAIPRIKQDINRWRSGIEEMERPILPFRYIVQQQYLDTVLDPHLWACIEKRKEMTLLRNYRVVDENGKEDEYWSKYLDRKWFKDFLSFSLDAIFFGYSLISMGDLVNGEFKNVTTIRRGNISPDRYNVSPVPYDPAGIDFTKEPYCDFHIWVSTPNPHGMSNCGYGLLYPVSPIAIQLKNNRIYNSNYNMRFATPFRVLKAKQKDDEEELAMKNSLINMGNSGWMRIDPDDDLEFLQGSSGKGYQAYTDFENMNNKLISKMILGHADALDSIAGKNGSKEGSNSNSGNKNASPQTAALEEKQAMDGTFLEPIINEQLIPLLIRNGVNFPQNLKFCWDNDQEEIQAQSTKNDETLKLSTAIMNAYNGGLQVDPVEFSTLTGLKFTAVPAPEPMQPEIKPESNTSGPVKNILNMSAEDAEDEEDIPIHDNCVCSIIETDGGLEWVLGDSASGPCDICELASDMFNAAQGDSELQNSIFQRHKGIIK